MAFVVLAFSCDEDAIDCSTVLCEGPPTLVFEVLQNGTNVFEAEVLDASDVSITGNAPGNISFQVAEGFFTGGDTQLLSLQTSAWEATSYAFEVAFGTLGSVNLEVDIELSSTDGCCGGIPFVAAMRLDGAALPNPNTVLTVNLD